MAKLWGAPVEEVTTAMRAAVATATTCGYACWYAREDVCRCYCGGKNHGCLRKEDGEQPQRTARINGVMYALAAVLPYYHGERVVRQIAEYCLSHDVVPAHVYPGGYRSLGDPDRAGYPARRRAASKSEVARWPELAGYRTRPRRDHPDLLWVRKDLFSTLSGAGLF